MYSVSEGGGREGGVSRCLDASGWLVNPAAGVHAMMILVSGTSPSVARTAALCLGRASEGVAAGHDRAGDRAEGLGGGAGRAVEVGGPLRGPARLGQGPASGRTGGAGGRLRTNTAGL